MTLKSHPYTLNVQDGDTGKDDIKDHSYTLNVQMDGDTGKDDIKESPVHAECADRW